MNEHRDPDQEHWDSEDDSDRRFEGGQYDDVLTFDDLDDDDLDEALDTITGWRIDAMLERLLTR